MWKSEAAENPWSQPGWWVRESMVVKNIYGKMYVLCYENFSFKSVITHLLSLA